MSKIENENCVDDMGGEKISKQLSCSIVAAFPSFLSLPKGQRFRGRQSSGGGDRENNRHECLEFATKSSAVKEACLSTSSLETCFMLCLC